MNLIEKDVPVGGPPNLITAGMITKALRMKRNDKVAGFSGIADEIAEGLWQCCIEPITDLANMIIRNDDILGRKHQYQLQQGHGRCT